MALSSTSFRPKWNSGPTTVVRVPARLAQAVVAYAQQLDSAASSAGEPAVAMYRTARDFSPTRPVNVASVPQLSPFRYPGGKTWLIPYIRTWLSSKCSVPAVLVEPFAGGGIVGLTAAFERLVDHVLLVERDADIGAVWNAILSGQAEWLAERIETFELTADSVVRILAASPTSQFERAFATILRNRVQRGGIMAPGAGLVKAGENGKGLASRWYPQTLARRIRDIAACRQWISFLESDGFEIIERYIDDARAAFFVDPPYTVAAKRLYAHWNVDHAALFKLLSRVRGDVLLTYDNTDEIHELAARHGFETHAIAMKNTHHAKMTELLIGRDLKWLRDAQASPTRTVQTSLAIQESHP